MPKCSSYRIINSYKNIFNFNLKLILNIGGRHPLKMISSKMTSGREDKINENPVNKQSSKSKTQNKKIAIESSSAFEGKSAKFSIIDEKYMILKRICGGEGYSKIIHAKDIKSNQPVVIKMLKPLYSRSFLNVLTIENEFRAIKKVNHQNVIKVLCDKYKGKKQSKKETKANKPKKVNYIVMEYATNGDLFEFVRVSRGFDEITAKFYLKQLIDGLEAMHKEGLTHRDIKLENLLLDDNFTLKIADLEFATDMEDSKTNEKLKLREKLGSDKYMAPELHFLHYKDRFYYGDKVDIFSAGIVYLAMLSGTLFFEKTNSSDHKFRLFIEDSYKFLHSYLTKKNPNISEESINLLENMLHPEMEKRISIEEIKTSSIYKEAEAINTSEVISKMKHFSTLICN